MGSLGAGVRTLPGDTQFFELIRYSRRKGEAGISTRRGLESREGVRRVREGETMAAMGALWSYCGPCGGGT